MKTFEIFTVKSKIDRWNKDSIFHKHNLVYRCYFAVFIVNEFDSIAMDEFAFSLN